MPTLQQNIAAFMNRALANPHTSIAGFAWIACKIGKIWLPRLSPQFEATETFIVGYGFFAAGDSSKAPPQAPTEPETKIAERPNYDIKQA